MKNYYDISPLISNTIAAFPGDEPFDRQISLDFAKGDHLLLSSIKTSVHVGAHADAPNHYHPDGVGIDKRGLDYYFGPCQVISVGAKLAPPYRIYPEDLYTTPITAERVLFHTGSYPNSDQWAAHFTALSPEAIDYLAEQNVRLVGIDTPSVDTSDAKTLETHQKIYQHDMAILEGIVLSDVPDGEYTLIALPLKIKDADASPVRAILVVE